MVPAQQAPSSSPDRDAHIMQAAALLSVLAPVNQAKGAGGGAFADPQAQAAAGGADAFAQALGALLAQAQAQIAPFTAATAHQAQQETSVDELAGRPRAGDAPWVNALAAQAPVDDGATPTQPAPQAAASADGQPQPAAQPPADGAAQQTPFLQAQAPAQAPAETATPAPASAAAPQPQAPAAPASGQPPTHARGDARRPAFAAAPAAAQPALALVTQLSGEAEDAAAADEAAAETPAAAAPAEQAAVAQAQAQQVAAAVTTPAKPAPESGSAHKADGKAAGKAEAKGKDTQPAAAAELRGRDHAPGQVKKAEADRDELQPPPAGGDEPLRHEAADRSSDAGAIVQADGAKTFSASHGEAAKVAPHTVSHLAAQIAAKSEGKATRFDVQLDPAGLGKVDVKIEIGRTGELTAALSFENPHAAAEMRSRAGELHRALEQAGFDLSKGGLSFDLSSQNQGRQFFESQPEPQRPAVRAGAFTDLAAAADPPPAPIRRALRRDGVDVTI